MATLAPSFLIESSSFLQVIRTCINVQMCLNFCKISTLSMELPALEHLKKMTYNLVATLAPPVLIGSSSFLHVTRTTIKSQQSSNFGQIR